MPVGRLVRQVADKHQVCTQRSWKRPYGVGLLVGGYDKTGSHLYNTCPSGNYYEYKAMAIGARSQVSLSAAPSKFSCNLGHDARTSAVCVHASQNEWLQVPNLSEANVSL